jgi:hypothetical protein
MMISLKKCSRQILDLPAKKFFSANQIPGMLEQEDPKGEFWLPREWKNAESCSPYP